MAHEDRGAPDFFRYDVKHMLTAYFDPSVKFDGSDELMHANFLELKEPQIKIHEPETHPGYTHHITALVGMLDHRVVYIDDQYNKERDPEHFGAVVCAEIYRQVVGFKNHPQLVSHLRRMKHREGVPIHEALGFDDIPHPNTLYKASQDRFDAQATEFIKRWANRLTRLGLKRGYEFPEVEEKRLSNNGGILEIPVEKKRGYAQAALEPRTGVHAHVHGLGVAARQLPLDAAFCAYSSPSPLYRSARSSASRSSRISSTESNAISE